MANRSTVGLAKFFFLAHMHDTLCVVLESILEQNVNNVNDDQSKRSHES
jgi:hypothetical protein